MPIKRRDTNENRLQHPLLQAGKKTAILWLHIKQNPGVTAYHLRQSPAYHPQVLADLVNEGLVSSKPSPHSSYKLYFAELENVNRVARTKVTVTVEIYEGPNGKLLYRTKAGGMSVYAQEEGARFLKEQKVTITLPLRSENEGMAIVSEGVDAEGEMEDYRPSKRAVVDDVIDADFVIVPNEEKGP